MSSPVLSDVSYPGSDSGAEPPSIPPLTFDHDDHHHGASGHPHDDHHHEPDFTPPPGRQDRTPAPDPLKLEKRGVTSQNATPRAGVTKQNQFDFVRTLQRDAICRALEGVGRLELTEGIGTCHTEQVFKMCDGCKRTSTFWNRCEQKFCPICSSRLARERRESVEWWCKQITQPKHVVLTARNTDTITKAHVLAFKEAFARLRRRKLARNWIGGFYSLEVTNEGRGWHLHLHALINARFIDSRALAQLWAELIGQTFAIVKVIDAREKSYLQEVTKYAVKGTELATWSGTDIAALFDAFDGVRTFGVFGSLYSKRTEFADYLKQLHGDAPACECGCTQFSVLTENEYNFATVEHDIAQKTRPPPVPRTPSQAPQHSFRL